VLGQGVLVVLRSRVLITGVIVVEPEGSSKCATVVRNGGRWSCSWIEGTKGDF
jgi:hypothetical protein